MNYMMITHSNVSAISIKTMNKDFNKQRNDAAQKLFKKPAGKLELCDLTTASFVPKGMSRAFRNNRYTVMIYDNTLTTKGFATKALIQKHDNTPIVNHWSELQAIKNEIFGHEVTAVEYYPKETKLINTHNIYWLWVFPNGIIPEMINL